jgi:Ca2+-dependent lipid-binding protein
MAGYPDAQKLLPLAQSENVDWLNKFFGKLWPNINKAAMKIVREQIEPKIKEKCGPLKDKIGFKEFTLGETPFVLGPINYYDLGERGMMLRISVNFKSDQDIQIECGPTNVGVKNFSFSGVLTMRFGQLIEEAPVIGSVVLYFLDCPKISFDKTGLAKVLEVPGLSGVVQRAIEDVIAGLVVFPNQIAVCLGTEEQGVDLAKVKFPTPIGVLKVRPKCATELSAEDWAVFGKATSDPYCIVKFCDESYETSTVTKTCDPKWPDTDYTYFLVYDRSQAIYCEVWDEDYTNPDDLIGYTAVMRLTEVLAHPDIKEPGIPLFKTLQDPNVDGYGAGGGMPELQGNAKLALDIEFYKFVHGSVGESDMCIMRIKLMRLFCLLGRKRRQRR